MKLQTIKFILLAVCFGLSIQNSYSQAKVQTDPVVGAAVIEQTAQLGGQLGAINVNQTAIMGENAAIQTTLNQIKEYEQTMLTYLNQAHGFFQTAQQVISATDKVSSIISELNQCRIAAQNHPQGLIVSTLVSKQYNKIILEATGLVGNVTTLVKGFGKKNLLNSAERLQILYSINAQLQTIYSSVRNLHWNIMCMKWGDIVRTISPELYYSLQNTDAAYNSALRTINLMSNGF